MEDVRGPDVSREEKLAQMVAQYERMLLHMCYIYLRDRGLAEDATQETFLKAYKAMPAFRGECSEKTWLMKIAMNTCRDMTRGSWFRWVDRRVALDMLPEPASEAAYRDIDALVQAIGKLPAKYKEVVLLYFYQRMTMKEVAYSLGIAVPTVSKRIKQACSKLKGMLGKEWDL